VSAQMRFCSGLAGVSFILLIAVATGALASPIVAEAQIPPGSLAAPPIFTADGVANVVFNGGTVDQLDASAASAGAAGVWVQDATGAFQLLLVGGPAFLKDTFRAKFPNGVGVVALTLIAPPGASSRPPSPASTATPTPFATPTLAATPQPPADDGDSEY